MSNSIILNSDKRTSRLDSPTDFKLKFHFPVEKGKYTLKYVYMPFTIKTINSTNNTLLVDGSPVTLPFGDYTTVESLRVVLQTALQTEDATFTVTATNNVLTITNTSTFILDFTDADVASVLGFQKRAYTSATTQTGAGIVNLNPLTSINIIINSRCDIRDNGSLAYTFRVPVTSDKDKYITYEPNMWQQHIEFTTDQHLLTIRVCDDSFRTIDTQLVDWWAVLEKV